MFKKYIFLIILVNFIVALYGCHSGGHAPFVNVNNGGDVVSSLTSTVNANGRLEHVIRFASGATIDTNENDTMQKDVEVTVTEVKTTNIGLNPIGTPQKIYIYIISAVLNTTDTLGNSISTPVYSLEKPLIITLPTSHLGTDGICYVGTRTSDNEPWRYTRLNENGNVTLSSRFLRASSEKLSSQYSFGLYRTNLQVALFALNEDSEKQSKSISADSFIATTTAVIAKKDGAYTEDLAVNFTLTGLNLDRIKATDLNALVTYKSNSKNPVTIKANGTNCTYVSRGESDAAVNGNNYFAHSFKIGSLNSESSMSGEAKYSFTLNLNGVKKEDFKSEFLLEVGCDSNITGLIPFSYAGYMKFETKEATEPEPTPAEVYTITYNLDGGKLPEGVTNPKEYTDETDSFTLKNPSKTGYTFLGWTYEGQSEPQTEVTITKGSMTGNKTFTANWVKKAPNTYSLDVVKGKGIDTVSGNGRYETGEEVTVSCTLLDGYENAVWSGCSTEVTFEMPAKNATMTVNASPISFSITYTLGDGATLGTGVTNPSSYDVTSATITLNNPTKTGYTFKGWTGTGIEEGTTSKTVTIPTGSTGDRSYTATWIKTDLVFDLGNGVKLYMNKVPNQNYYAGIYEVTQAEYYAIMGTNPSAFSGDNKPVEKVSWNDIMTENTGFMAKINAQLAEQLTAKNLSGYIFNLPTQEQWEYTCRAGSTGDYSKDADGNEVTQSTLGDYAWYSDNSSNSTHDVGTKEPNLWGFYDMHGNVYERCSDVVEDVYGSHCAARGGCWCFDECRSSIKTLFDPDDHASSAGFRLFLFPGN